MNKYQKIYHKKTKLIQGKVNGLYNYRDCKKMARIRAIYDFYRLCC